MVFEALVIDRLSASELVNTNDQRAKVLKSSNGPHVQNNQTEGGEAKKSDGDSEEVASDDGVAVLLQVKLFRFVKFFIAHDKKYSTMAADDRPDMPLKMWL